MQSGEKTLAEALAEVVKNADLKESYFTTPIALGAHQNFGNKWRRLGDGKGKNDYKGDWKGDRKGKKGKKGDGKQGGGKDHHGNPLASKTPDGRVLCLQLSGLPGPMRSCSCLPSRWMLWGSQCKRAFEVCWQ